MYCHAFIFPTNFLSYVCMIIDFVSCCLKFYIFLFYPVEKITSVLLFCSLCYEDNVILLESKRCRQIGKAIWSMSHPVSYTHLDVYKRQVPTLVPCPCALMIMNLKRFRVFNILGHMWTLEMTPLETMNNDYLLIGVNTD